MENQMDVQNDEFSIVEDRVLIKPQNETQKEISAKGIRRIFWINDVEIGLNYERDGKDDTLVVRNEPFALQEFCQKIQAQNANVWIEEPRAKAKKDYMGYVIGVTIVGVVGYILVTALF